MVLVSDWLCACGIKSMWSWAGESVECDYWPFYLILNTSPQRVIIRNDKNAFLIPKQCIFTKDNRAWQLLTSFLPPKNTQIWYLSPWTNQCVKRRDDRIGGRLDGDQSANRPPLRVAGPSWLGASGSWTSALGEKHMREAKVTKVFHLTKYNCQQQHLGFNPWTM